MRKMLWFGAACGFGVLYACSVASLSSSKTLSRDEDPWQKRWWIEKTSRALRYGKGLGPSESMQELEKLEPAEIVDRFMSGEDFEKSLLDLNLYFSGQRLSDFMFQSSINWSSLVQMRSAVTGTREIVSDGDFFKFFDYRQPLYAESNLLPSDGSNSSGCLNCDDEQKTPEEIAKIRADILQKSTQEADELLKFVRESHPDRNLFCAEFKKSKNFGDAIFRLGVPNSLRDSIQFSRHWLLNLDIYCEFPQVNMQVDAEKTLQHVRDSLIALVPLLPANDRSEYTIKGVRDIRVFDANILGMADDVTFFQDGSFFRRFPNSSTNYDRKRAAFVLKRYFCDDLTPLNVELPADHAGSEHASNPSCQSCHYKLDPMAGFFRNFGVQGINFSDSDTLLFDDLAQANRSVYEQAWKSKSNTREFDIGYIRSTKDERLNTYGESMEDLSHILKTSPEVKQCLVRRIFNYFVSENQATDAGYMNELSQSFIEESKINSADAFKRAIKKVVLSRTFATQNPAGDECYDLPTGTQENERPPCQVAFLFEKNCSSCHDGRNGGDPEAGLSLTQWVRLPSGEFSFPHVTDAGAQRGKKDSLQIIYDRLTYADRSKRPMPPRHIDAVEREKLATWLNSEIQKK